MKVNLLIYAFCSLFVGMVGTSIYHLNPNFFIKQNDMAGVNKVILLGRVGQDPQQKVFESGSTVVTFSVATSERYKDRNGNQAESTEWHNIEIWEALAKVAHQYLKKGDMVYLEGKIKTDSWTDNDGNNRKTTKIRATSMQLMPKAMGGQGGGNSATQSPPQQPTADPVMTDPLKPEAGAEIDDLPF